MYSDHQYERHTGRTKIACLFFAASLLASSSLPARSRDVSEYLGPQMPYAQFDALPHSTVVTPGGNLELGFAPGLPDRQRLAVREWVSDSGRAMATYLGRFPVERFRILIVPVPGRAIHGTTWGILGAATRITLGMGASSADIVGSWVLTHEMVHVGFPRLARQHLWLEEGLATYIEPIARAQAGLVPAEHVWRQLLWGVPQGLPKVGDRGLDRTHTWGRTYWGGALFCLLADIEIRRQTDGRQSLQDALRAIVAAGGTQEVDWPLDRVLDVADHATGTSVLSDLYRSMSETPVDTDLEGVWKSLGVSTDGGRVIFDESAPLAAIRRAITAPET